MRLTKDGQRVWDEMIAKGMTPEEIIEDVPVFPHEYESKEEEEEHTKKLKEFIAAEVAKRTPEEQRELEEFAAKLKKEDEENEK